MRKYPSFKDIFFSIYNFSCHLKKFSENNEKRKNLNEFTRLMAEIPKHVDNFHFKNHVDPWCHKMCNPKYDLFLCSNRHY